jgi:CheY-like chemotaxis protein
MNQPLILVVDDAPEIGVIARRLGRDSGHVIAVEPSAESAWDFLQRTRQPDLVLLDQNLPGASGCELCRRLRATPALVRLAVALFSHWERPGDIAAGLDAGTDFVLSKDLLCEPEQWRQRLAEILAWPGGQRPPFLLTWQQTEQPPYPRRLVERINQALHSPAAWPFGAEVVRPLVQRTGQANPKQLAPIARDPSSWLLPDGLGVDASRLVAQFLPEAIVAFVTALTEQIWRLLGTAGGAAFWAALHGTDPTGAPHPAHR